MPRFLERDEAAKQTLALEYTFGRKTNQNLVKVSSKCLLSSVVAFLSGYIV